MKRHHTDIWRIARMAGPIEPWAMIPWLAQRVPTATVSAALEKIEKGGATKESLKHALPVSAAAMGTRIRPSGAFI